MARITISLAKSPEVDSKKHSNEFRKKHIRHARAMEKAKRESALFSRITSWLSSGEFVDHSAIKQFFVCIKQLVKLMGYEYKKNLLTATVIYADRYVRNTSLISANQLFRLMLTSTVATMKFWEDCGVDLELCSYVFGIEKKSITVMERHFLTKIDYKLFLTKDDLLEFERECEHQVVLSKLQETVLLLPTPPTNSSTEDLLEDAILVEDDISESLEDEEMIPMYFNSNQLVAQATC